MSHSKSILQAEKRCFVCGTALNLQRHHCLGGCLRQTAEGEGLWIWLCNRHHTGEEGIHRHPAELKALAAWAQRMWMKQNNASMEDWLKLVGKNFL